MTKATVKPPKTSERVRTVGQPVDRAFEVDLTPEQCDKLKDSLMDHLDQREAIKDKLAEVKKNFASQLETNEATIDAIRRQVRARKERRTVRVQDWLTKSNEIVTVSVATNVVIGEPRTATAAELQEELPLDRDSPTQDTQADSDDGRPFDMDDGPNADDLDSLAE